MAEREPRDRKLDCKRESKRSYAAVGPGPLDPKLYCDQFDIELPKSLAARELQLQRETSATFRAMEGWGRLNDHEQWLEIVRKAADDLENGEFLIGQLGAQRFLDPPMMA